MKDPLQESKIAEAANAAAVSKEADIAAIHQNLGDIVDAAVQKAFSAGVADKRYIDITRIPLICQSIVGIDARLKGIESNITWGVRIVIGAVLVALLTLVLKG